MLCCKYQRPVTIPSCTFSDNISLAKNIQEPGFYVTTMIWFSMAWSQLQHCSSLIQEYFCHQMNPLKISGCALEALVQVLKKLCNPLCLWSFFMRLFFCHNNRRPLWRRNKEERFEVVFPVKIVWHALPVSQLNSVQLWLKNNKLVQQ